MTTIAQLSTLPAVHALGWTLLHFCWQGAVAVLLLAGALAAIPARASRLRYAAACGALALMAALPLVTFGVLATRAQAETRALTMVMTDRAGGPTVNAGANRLAEPWTVWCKAALNRSLPAVIAFWLAGVIVLLCRLNLGLMATGRMKRVGAEPGTKEEETMVRTLGARLGIARTVALLHSARVEAPAVIGWLKPAILLPVGCMAGLSAAQVEAVVAHELAHVRRHDYLVNLFQSVVETVLFYHPGVWWVSGRIRREREHCCDDLAVAVTGDRLAYVKALSLLEEMRAPLPAGAFAAAGGVLKTRIARLLGVNEGPAFPRAAAVALLALAGTAAGVAAFGSVRAQTATAAQGASSEESGTAQIPRVYRQWVDQDVRWIITPREKQAFLRLRNNEERDEFIEQFWDVRNPNPGSAVNTYRQEHYRRIAYANMHFGEKEEPGWETDRGHVYIVFGPPDSIDAHLAEGGGSERPFEVWHYRSIEMEAPAAKSGAGYGARTAVTRPAVTRKDVDFRFVDECGCGRYELRSPWPSAEGAESKGPAAAQPANDRSNAGQSAARGSLAPFGEVRSVTIVSSDLPESTRAQIGHALSGGNYPLSALSLLVRQQLRDRGYVEASAETENLAGLLASPDAYPVDVTVRVDAGAQYRLGGIVVEGERAFSQKKILEQFPIHAGEMFNATEIGKGLDRLKKLYWAKGYTHFGAIPTLQMDEKQHTVTLTLRLIEGKAQAR